MPKEIPFPILRHKEIQEMLTTFLNVDLQASDLEKPTAERVHSVFEALVSTLLGPQAFDYSVLQSADFPELFAEAAPKIAFFSRLQNLFSKLMVKDFCYEDLVRPESARFVLQLSGVMNFLRFRAERLQILHECETQQLAITEERRILDEALLKKTTDLTRLREMHASEQREAEAMEPERQNRRQRCYQLSKSHDQLFNQFNGIKHKINKLKNDLSAITFELSSKNQERDDLEDRIVQSPSKIESRIATLTAKLKETRDNSTELLALDTTLTEEIESIQEWGKLVEENLNRLTAIQTAKEIKKDTSRHVKEAKAQFDRSTTIYQQLADEINKLAQTYEQATQRLREAIANLQHVQTEVETALNEREREKREVEQHNQEILSTVIQESNHKMREWDEKRAKLQENHKDTLQHVFKRYRTLERSFKQWLSNVQGLLSET